jgi:hypothetical protein
MKIIIAGSRDVTDYEIVRQAVIHSGYWKLYGKSIEVVSGTARGVDRLGEEFAKRNGLLVHKFPADWDTHGKAGGHIRNRYMGTFAKEHDGLLLAIWDGVSPGTEGMIDYARSIGLRGFVYRTDKPLRYAVQVGMNVTTNFSGRFTNHVVTSIVRDGQSQSGIMLQVKPAVPKADGIESWIDCDWFKEV